MFKFKIGDYVEHRKFGVGHIAALTPEFVRPKYLVKFENHSTYCSEENLTLKERPAIMKIVLVEFPTNYTQYHFKTDLSLEVGDQVVVDTKNGFGVAEVVGFRESSVQATKWVVQKVNIQAHERRLDQERKVLALKKELETRRKALEEEAIHTLMSNLDPEYARIHSTLAAMGEV